MINFNFFQKKKYICIYIYIWLQKVKQDYDIEAACYTCICWFYLNLTFNSFSHLIFKEQCLKMVKGGGNYLLMTRWSIELKLLQVCYFMYMLGHIKCVYWLLTFSKMCYIQTGLAWSFPYLGYISQRAKIDLNLYQSY